MPLLPRVAKLSRNAKFPFHITSVRVITRSSPISRMIRPHLHRCPLSLGSHHTSRAIPHQHWPERRPRISLAQSTRVTCLLVARMGVKFPYSGTVPLNQSCGSHTFSIILSGSCGPLFVSHHIWLRDHCRCPECFHSITKQRLIRTFEVTLFGPRFFIH